MDVREEKSKINFWVWFFWMEYALIETAIGTIKFEDKTDEDIFAKSQSGVIRESYSRFPLHVELHPTQRKQLATVEKILLSILF